MNEMRECRAQCGNRGVDACFVRRSLQITGATGEGKKIYGVKEEVICSCNDEESRCPDQKALFKKFLQNLIGGTSNANGSSETGNPDLDDASGTSTRNSTPAVIAPAFPGGLRMLPP
ncbi:MAG TPA: hypothetical protein VF816_09690 [Rhodocyclaceae bacterium]